MAQPDHDQFTQTIQVYPNPPLPGPGGWIILLHGWGANAQDLASLAPLFGFANYQFVMLQAPLPHPQVPGGYMWYDLSDFERKPGLELSRDLLKNWLTTADIDLSRTVLAGFSQGGAMTLDVGLDLPLAGLVVFSGYLHNDLAPRPSYPPVLMIHGQQDLVVSPDIAQASVEQLQSHGVQVDYHELSMGHEINPPSIQLGRTFIQACLAS